MSVRSVIVGRRRHELGTPVVLLGGLLAVAVAAYVVLLAVHAAGLLDRASWNADAVIPWMLADAWDAPGPRELAGGQYPFYSVVWFDLLTGWLPGHRAIWGLQPIVLTAATIALVAWAVGRLAGPPAAALAVVLAGCTSPDVLLTFFQASFHGTTFFAAVLLAVALLVLARRRTTPTTARLAAAAVGLGVVTGVHLVDALLIVCGVVPFLLAALAWRLADGGPAARRALTWAAGVAAIAVAVRFASVAVMEAAGLETVPPGGLRLELAPAQVADNARLLAELIWVLGDGGLQLSTRGVARGLLALGAAAAVTAGALVPIVLAARACVAAARGRAVAPAELVHLVFWGATAAGLMAAVLLTGVAVELPAFRYVIPLVFGMAATVPLLLRDGGRVVRAAALAGCCVLVTSGAVALADERTTAMNDHDHRARDAVLAFAREHGVADGFAFYWAASNLTWKTDGEVVLRPVGDCDAPGAALCRHPIGSAAAWYRPTGRARTLLLWPTGLPVPDDAGRPLARREVGIVENWPTTAYVLAGDLAERLGPAPSWGGDSSGS